MNRIKRYMKKGKDVNCNLKEYLILSEQLDKVEILGSYHLIYEKNIYLYENGVLYYVGDVNEIKKDLEKSLKILKKF